MWKSTVGITAGWLLLALAMVACGAPSRTATQLQGEGGEAIDGEAAPYAATLIPLTAMPDLGPAPQIDNQVWLNTDRPLRLAELRGKVVLVEFWTYG